MEVILHVGAHKTASTYVQKILEQNIDVLSANSICYIPLKVMRDEKITRQIKKSKNIEGVRKKLESHFLPDLKKLIISDENILGNAAEVYNSGGLYDDFEQSIRFVRQVFNGQDIKIVIVIRDYAPFFSSLYCEFLRHRKEHCTFSHYINGYAPKEFSWVPIIKTLAGVIGENNLEIVKYESFQKNNQVVFDTFFDTNEVKLNYEMEKTYRASYLMKSIEIVNDIAKYHSDRDAGLLREAINNKLLKLGEEQLKYTAFTQEETDTLHARYQIDLEVLGQTFNILST